MHDNRFDDELKNRLGNYAEEPDDALWQGIAAGISSTPAGLGWLRWISRGFLVSFAVVSILVNGSKFNVQGSTFDSKFKIQDSGSGREEWGLMADEDSKFQIPDSKLSDVRDVGLIPNSKFQIQDSKLEGEHGGNTCDDVNDKPVFAAQRDGGDAVADAQRAVMKRGKGMDGVDGGAPMAAGDAEGERRRSKAEEKKSPVVARKSKREDKKQVVEARRSRHEDGRVNVEAGKSAAEGSRAKYEVKRSMREENNSKAGALRANAEHAQQRVVVERSAGEKAHLIETETERTNTQAGSLTADGTVAEERGMRDEKVMAVEKQERASTEAVVPEPSVGGMNAVFGPPMYVRSDTAMRGQQGMRRTVDAEVVQMPDSTQKVDPLAKRRSARAEVLKKEREEDKADDRALRRVSMYFTAMPTLGYQRIEANPADNIIVESFQKVSNGSSKRLGVRAELGLEYRLTPRINAFGGLLYYQRKQTIRYVERVSTGVTHHTSGDTLTIDPQFTLQDKAFEYELKNIGVQLGVNYTLWKRKFLHVAGTGVEFHKALNKLSEAQKQQGFSANPSTYVFYNLYYRVQYPAEGRLKAIFQPTLNYSLFLNQDMNAPFYVKPYGLGLNLGLTYNF